MAARLTPKQAAALGLVAVAKEKKKRTTRTEAKGPYWSRCKTCAAEFTTIASEDRHLKATHHARYDILRDT